MRMSASARIKLAGRPEQRMTMLDRAHGDAVDLLDRPHQQLRLDLVNAVAIGAERLVANDEGERDGVDPEDQWPFLRDDVEQVVDAVGLDCRDTASWIAAVAPEWPRANAIRSWFASSTAPSLSRRRANAWSLNGITRAMPRMVRCERLISYNLGDCRAAERPGD